MIRLTNYSSLPGVPQAIACLKSLPMNIDLRDSMLQEVTLSLSKLYVYSDIIHNASDGAPQLPDRYADTITVHDVAIDTYDPLWQSAGIPYSKLVDEMATATTMYDFWDRMSWLMFRISDAHSYVTAPYDANDNGIKYGSFPPLPLNIGLDDSGKQIFYVDDVKQFDEFAAYDPSARIHAGKTISTVNGKPVADYIKRGAAAPPLRPRQHTHTPPFVSTPARACGELSLIHI